MLKKLPNNLFSCLLAFGVIISMISCNQTEMESVSPSFPQMEEQQPFVLLIKHRADSFSIENSNQLTRAMDYTKLPYRTIDLGLISEGLNISARTKVIVLTTYMVDGLNTQEIQKLVEFVSEGNQLIITTPIYYNQFAFFQGLDPESDYGIDSTGRGVHLEADAFPESKGLTYLPQQGPFHHGFKKSVFKESVEILASTETNREVPLIVANKIGLGEVLTYNSNLMDYKYYRGLLFAGILRGLNGVPYSVANVSSIFLDDFPAPLYNQKLPPIDEEYGVSHADFVAKIWWPDMQAFADTFNITYTAMTAFNYNANVVPPFDFNEWRSGIINLEGNSLEGSIYLAKDISESRHELAFHGYNHFSLWENDWSDSNFMVAAVQAARKRWRVDNLGELPTNYVPPTNNIDSAGIQAVLQGMPSIEYMSSLYLGQVEEGGGREFGPDPYAPSRLFDYPRITSGFTMKNNSLFEQQSLQLLTGIWTHFIHPDDVFQVTQRTEDEYSSRNPLKLGWMSDDVYDYGLYHLFRNRVQYTNKRYPILTYTNATNGGMFVQDWVNKSTLYQSSDAHFRLVSFYRNNYKPHLNSAKTSWYMYVSGERVKEIEPYLEAQDLTYARSGLWDGYLYQITSENETLTVPDLAGKNYHTSEDIDAIVMNELVNHQYYLLGGPPQPESTEPWRDTRLQEALAAYRQNPGDLNVQNRLIELYIEMGEVEKSVEILEERILKAKELNISDSDSLITYYGWLGAQSRAEKFLEKLWVKYENDQVLDIKKTAVEELGLYGQEFEQRWLKRELQLNPDDDQLKMAYLKSIESEENWPEMKRGLLGLIEENPESDTLYAFTLQRSLYYGSPDSTVAMLERFPEQANRKLLPMAENIAQLYAYELNNRKKALYWAEKAPDYNQDEILQWLLDLNLYNRFLEKGQNRLAQNAQDTELRSYIGTQLFYEGFREQAYDILYPMFEDNVEKGTAADTLIRNEIQYLSYSDKKDFYKKYPAFFKPEQEESLKQEYRWKEAPRIFANGEFRNDNFDNAYGRTGLGIEWGNRRSLTHSLKGEELFISDAISEVQENIIYSGLNYELRWQSASQEWVVQSGTGLLTGNQEILPELKTTISYSHDSTFTSLALEYNNVLTTTALEQNIDRIQMQFYREDYRAGGHLVTAFGGTGRYFTNEVFGYELYNRNYLQFRDNAFRIRPLTELSYAHATTSYISGNPYYTPDHYFSKGLGMDLRYRHPNNYDYESRVTVETIAKHEREDGFYLTGRARIEHKFNNYWQVDLVSEVSTSKLYRSNRIYFSVSYYFPKSLQ